MSDLIASPLRLPDGRLLDPRRPRSAGRLGRAEIAACRAAGAALAYDPVQQGWVALSCDDDIDDPSEAEPDPGAPLALGRHLLRPWSLDDVPVFVALLDDPSVWEHLPEDYPAPLTAALARDLIEIANAGAHHEVLAIVSDGEIVGQVRLAFEPGAAGGTQAELGYWLGAAHRGRGVAGEVVGLYTRAAFARRPRLEAIHAVVHPQNRASARVLEKAGYRAQGASARHGGRHVYRFARADSGC